MIESFVSSNYKFPDAVIDVEKYDKDVDRMLLEIQEDKIKLCEIGQSIRSRNKDNKDIPNFKQRAKTNI